LLSFDRNRKHTLISTIALLANTRLLALHQVSIMTLVSTLRIISAVTAQASAN